MKTAEIVSVPLTHSGAYGWRWRPVEGQHESPHWFVFYGDCVIDARRNGYTVCSAIGERVAALAPMEQAKRGGTPGARHGRRGGFAPSAVRGAHNVQE